MSSPFQLPKLPYADNALEPHISANTISFHYGKHHQTYVTKLNELVANTEFASMSLEDIIKKTSNNSDKIAIFNNAAQIWNHTFYWNCLKPNGGGLPNGAIAEKINATFGSYEKFKTEFANAALTQFGSGWAWLVVEANTLKIVKTPNAETPITKGQIPLLTIDVWEHAYYIDYQNKRPDYTNTVIDKLLNWDFANENLLKA